MPSEMLTLTRQKPDGTSHGFEMMLGFPVAGSFGQQQEWLATAWQRFFRGALCSLFAEEMQAASHADWQAALPRQQDETPA